MSRSALLGLEEKLCEGKRGAGETKWSPCIFTIDIRIWTQQQLLYCSVIIFKTINYWWNNNQQICSPWEIARNAWFDLVVVKNIIRISGPKTRFWKSKQHCVSIKVSSYFLNQWNVLNLFICIIISLKKYTSNIW